VELKTQRSIAPFCTSGNGQGVLIDVKALLNRNDVEAENLIYWCL
jgi:hypothetical protein